MINGLTRVHGTSVATRQRLSAAPGRPPSPPGRPPSIAGHASGATEAKTQVVMQLAASSRIHQHLGRHGQHIGEING